jgi:hypothetical protein
VLLDECVDPAMAAHFTRHEAVSVLEAGLTSLSNGELLRAAEPVFDAFVTVDKGIVYQQNLAGFDLVFVLLRVGSNRAEALPPYVGRIEGILDSASPARFHLIEPEP